MNDILTYLSQLTGLQPATLVLLGGLIITISNVVSRLIPDDATGFLGAIRIVTKLLGANVASRITSGVTVNDVTRSLLQTPDSRPEIEDQLKSNGVLPNGSGVAGITRQANGKFAKTKANQANSTFGVTIVVFLLVILSFGLAGCATISDAKITKTLCENQIASRAWLNLKTAEDSKIKDDALRQAALALDEALLARLNSCPSVGGPVPIGR